MRTLNPYQTHVGPSLHELDDMVQPPLIVDEDIAVQDRHVLPFSQLQTLVDAPDGAGVLSVLYIVG